ncbi:MAG: family N-acetyltransferase [Paenibacillaceae bacterium]|jgi:ribosomal protein S18 acetylase RimI-like enzyme|nr:family N-acetyltransferase [Paenibacillaceae bacterium]
MMKQERLKGEVGMIRTRIPEQDDPGLFRMIIVRLLPYARQARPDVAFNRSEIRRRWRKCKVYVAVNGKGRPEGFISCKVEGSTLTIDMLAVERHAEGHGIGSSLIAAAENYGRRKGAASVRLAVDEPNLHAQSFYHKKGYGVETYFPGHKMYILSKWLQ